jgi:hypothetical protein
MSGDKHFLSLFKQPLGRATRIILLCWGVIIAVGSLATYFHSLMPWIAGAVSLGVAAWVVIAVVRWRRSKW